MSSPDDARKSSNPKADSSNRGSFTPSPASSQTDRLLDINGLLDMVRLISTVRKEGRIGEASRAGPEYANE